MLNFLAKWDPTHSFILRQLILKTLALIAPTSSDRGRTLHLINIVEHTDLTDKGISFIKFDRLDF